MKNLKAINEDMTKADVEKAVKVYLDSATFAKKVEKIVKDRLAKDKDIEDKMVEITKNVLTQLYKTLWTKRNFWSSSLTNKTS